MSFSFSPLRLCKVYPENGAVSSTPSSIGKPHIEVVSNIDLCIRSDALDLNHVTQILGVEPTSGWEPGATHVGDEEIDGEIRELRRPPRAFGVWHYNTSFALRHDSLQEHALILLERFEPVADQLRRFKERPDYSVSLSLWHVGPAAFSFDSSILARLAALSEWISFTCWTNEEAE
jgi:hypothetical protein